MAKAYLVLPQGYGYDDFYYFESTPNCAQPEAIFKTRGEAETFLERESAKVLKNWGVPIHVFHREENDELPGETIVRVKELLGVDPNVDLAEYFTEYPDLASLSIKKLAELIELLSVKVLCIVEAEIKDEAFAAIHEGVNKRDPTRVFRQTVSENFRVPIDEYEPFPDD
ncbi:MAG: hypothetical protein AAGI63_05220 [Planctomycetota bacterium]